LYPADNREKLVLNGGDSTTVPSPPAHLWVYGGNHGDPQTLTNIQFMVNSSYALFADYHKAISIYKCPADRSLWPVWNSGVGSGKMVPELRSYSLNSYLGTLATASGAPPPVTTNNGFRIYATTASLAASTPSQRFAFMDVNPANICTPAFGVDMVSDTWVHYPSFLHGGLGVVSFTDGHVESHKWLDPRTHRNLRNGEPYIPHSDFSPNNQDLYWIRDRTTSRK